jgi:hypothetical protein
MLSGIGNILGVLLGLSLCTISLIGIFQIITSKDEESEL